MAQPSTSFQPPLPTSAPPPPPTCPPPPPPPLPPSKPPVDSRSESLPTPSGYPITVPPPSICGAQSLETSFSHSAATLSHLPSLQSQQPTSGAPLPQGSTSDRVTHAGERPK